MSSLSDLMIKRNSEEVRFARSGKDICFYDYPKMESLNLLYCLRCFL